MSGVELIGAISGTIALIEAAVKVYNAATDASGLPEAVRGVAQRLPLAKDILQTTKSQVEAGEPDEDLCEEMIPILKGCKERVERLERIFQKVIPDANAPRKDRYVSAIKTIGKGKQVESLMKEILEDIQLLVGNRVMKSKKEIGSLEKAIEEMSTLQPTTYEESWVQIDQCGSGLQAVHTSTGPEHNSNISGMQFVRSNFFNCTPIPNQIKV